MPITALYAGLLAILLLILSARVIGVRRAEKISLGDGDNRQLQQRIRVHANFVEYTPFALILIGLIESLKAPSLLLHGLGLALLMGRAIHAYGLSQSPQIMVLRVGGMVLTLAVVAIAAAWCLFFGMRGLV